MKTAAQTHSGRRGRYIPMAVVLLFLVVGARAEADQVLGIHAGVGGWRQSVEGDLRAGVTAIDVEQDLAVSDETDVMAYLEFEHPIPGLPNLRLQYTDTNMGGAGVLSRNIQVNGVTFRFSTAVRTDLELTQADAIFYYRVLDNAVSLDLGIAARYIDGQIAVLTTARSAQANFTGALPQLYGRLRIDLPVTGLWLSAQGQGLGYRGDQLLDLQATLGYESSLGLGLELGWRSLRLRLEDFDDLDQADIDIAGPYLQLSYQL